MRTGLWRVVAVLALCAWTAPALGQDEDAFKEAAKAFAQGEKAFAARDYDLAASRFAEAYRLSPHPNALWNEARALMHAGQRARAANAYAKYLRDAAPNARDRADARKALDALSKQLLRIDVSAEGFDTVLVDDQRVEGPGIYVDPGRHVVDGRAGDRVAHAEASGDAGAVVGVALVLPAPPPAPAPAPVPAPVPAPAPALAPAPAPAPAPSPTPEPASHGWSPVVFWISAGVTVAAAGATTWSGLDTLSYKKNTYDPQSTSPQAGTLYDTGHEKMQRTNFLLAISGAAAVFTAATAIWLTDWHGGKESSAAVGLGPGSLQIAGTFR